MRLIDADALIRLTSTRGFRGNKFAEVIKAYVDEMPTIEERKKGTWIPQDCLGRPSIDKDVCSCCGQRFYQIAETGCEWNYCPNCGAKMEVEQNEQA